MPQSTAATTRSPLSAPSRATVGDDRGQAGGDALALVEMLDRHGHGVVRRDADEGVRYRWIRRRCGKRRPKINGCCDHEGAGMAVEPLRKCRRDSTRVG